MNCTASVEYCKNIPITTSKYAAEGTFAHEVLELNITEKYKYHPDIEMWRDNLVEDKYFNKEMLVYLEKCEKYIEKLEPFRLLFIEKRFAIPEIEGFGTVDYTIVKDGTLHIIDLKYGKGKKVTAEDNTQLKLYAWGAYRVLSKLLQIHTIVLHIMQPRINKNGSFLKWEISVKNLKDWVKCTVSVKAKTALSGTGIFKEGGWCWFCPGKDTCPTLVASDYEDDWEE